MTGPEAMLAMSGVPLHVMGDTGIVDDPDMVVDIEGDPGTGSTRDRTTAIRLADRLAREGMTVMAGMTRVTGFAALRHAVDLPTPVAAVTDTGTVGDTTDPHRIRLIRRILDHGGLVLAAGTERDAMRARMRLAGTIIIVNTPIAGPLIDGARLAARRGVRVWACPTESGSWTRGREGCELLIGEGTARPLSDPDTTAVSRPDESTWSPDALDRLLDARGITDPEERAFHHMILARTGHVMGNLTHNR